MRRNKAAVSLLLGYVGAVHLNGLPPYWDGYYSKTWRYAMPEWKVMNQNEYKADEPAAYANAVYNV